MLLRTLQLWKSHRIKVKQTLGLFKLTFFLKHYYGVGDAQTVQKFVGQYTAGLAVKVTAESRTLQIGDALWLARRIAPPHQEYVLDYLIERKGAAPDPPQNQFVLHSGNLYPRSPSCKNPAPRVVPRLRPTPHIAAGEILSGC